MDQPLHLACKWEIQAAADQCHLSRLKHCYPGTRTMLVHTCKATSASLLLHSHSVLFPSSFKAANMSQPL